MSTQPANEIPWTPQVGDLVVVLHPNDYLADVRNKISGRDGARRVGEIVRFQDGDDDYVVVRFPALGRRKEFRHIFRRRALGQADLIKT